MHDLRRRDLLKLGSHGAAAGTAALAGLGAPQASHARSGGVLLPYPERVVGRAATLEVGSPVSFSYPDAASPCVLLKLGRAAPGGVGPAEDIVAYSALCTHQGCPVAYDPRARTFKCPCHFSIFDPEKGGQQVCGQATESLPQVVLEYDGEQDRVTAVSVQGLIYGRVCNVLDEG